MSQSRPSDELAELLQCLAEESISPAQHARLAELLKADPAARARYRQMMDVHALLHWRERQAPELKFPTPGAGEAARGETTQTAPPEAKSRPSILQTKYWREHRAKFAALALALTVLFWVGFYFAVLRSGPEDVGPEGTHEAFIARVSGERGARWAAGTTPVPVEETLGSGERIELAGGYLEITFGNEAIVLLEGPASFTIDNRSGGTLERGRLVARADTAAAKGFYIGTPLAQIVDMGTEFGVSSFEATGTSVEVFEGRVEATPRQRAADRRIHPSTLVAGQTASLAAGEAEFQLRDEPEPIEYVQDLPAAGEPLRPPVIVPVGVTCSVVSEGQHPPEKLIDGSGLAGAGELSDLRHQSAVMVEGLEQERNYWVGVWGGAEPVRLTFDLGSEQELSSMTIWNYGGVGTDVHRCPTVFRYAVSSDGENFTEVAKEELTVEGTPTVAAQVFPLEATARYVRIEILETAAAGQNVGEVALGEVRFEGRLAADAPSEHSQNGQ